ncbi:MAG TPA: ATP-binding protein, partial [Gemmatimonadaceae bacterium]|nr:ATP-binding protein [Gemmatimonadaceae bacterium]
EKQADSLGSRGRSGTCLGLINDVLNLARIEAGRVEYNLAVCNLKEVADAVLPMVEPQLHSRRIGCAVHIAHELTAYADREKVQQILLNLLSNATKFTPADGSVTVTGSAAGARGEHVRLVVRDTGVGIPAERLAQVFEPFVQVDDSHARRAEGTGLGLAISRDLARGMGGDLTAESEVGVGSAFALTLPALLPA